MMPEEIALLRDAVAESTPRINVTEDQMRFCGDTLMCAAALLQDTGESDKIVNLKAAIDTIRAALNVLVEVE